MEKFVFLLKTYEKDLRYAIRLIKSFQKYNVDNIKLYIVLPKEDIIKLNSLLEESDKYNIIIKDERSVCPYMVDKPLNGISAGYINQEIVKLSFWENDLCENYFCVDSDAVFIREFGYNDFMASNGFPYTVLLEDKRLKSDPIYYKEFWIDREKSLKKILDEFQMDRHRYMTCHGFQTFNKEVLESLKTEFMRKKHYSYSDLLEISPYEFSWYNFYLQKTQIIPINVSDEIFKTFHLKEHYLNSCLNGVEIGDLARAYVGIVINSNFTNGKSITYGDVNEIHVRVSGKLYRYILKERMYTVFREPYKVIKHLLLRVLDD